MNLNIENIDYIVILSYLVGIFFLAFKSSRQIKAKNLLEEQYLAGKSLTVTESLCSIIATEVSALTFLGIPAFAYGADFSFIQIYLGALFGRIIIAKIMLPRIYDRGITIYSVMGHDGSKEGQRSIAILYSLNKFLAVGVRLFSGSILVAQFFNTNIYLAVALICFLTFFYTLVGGLKAVVRTDMVQMLLFITGGITANYIIPQVSELSWTDLIMLANNQGKLNFFDFSNPYPFIIGVMGGILFDMATHGVDQDFVQRLTANKSLKGAQFAIMASSFLSIFVGVLFLSIGALLWSHYQIHTAPSISNDQLFAHFITQYFPIGIKGLMVAGVLAATMSTLDSTINALSSCLYNDIFHHRETSAKKIKLFYFRDTLAITLILMSIAFWASTSDGLLIFGLKITSWTAGSLLALFFGVSVFKLTKLTTFNVIGVYIVGVLGVSINTYLLQWNWNLNIYFGFSLGLLFLYTKTKIYQRAFP
jgi:solute:Na+ symporter, SSS family